MIQLTETNNRLQKEVNRAKEQAGHHYTQIIEKKDLKIKELQSIVYKETDIQGKQLLEALKTGQPVEKPVVSRLDDSA